jgi:hypothetical protein
MDKTMLKAAMLSAISGELDLWLDKESSIKDGYEYEDEFIKTAQKVTHLLFSKSLGSVSCNRNKKNSIPVLGSLK